MPPSLPSVASSLHAFLDHLQWWQAALIKISDVQTYCVQEFLSQPSIYLPLNEYFVTDVLFHAFTNRLLKCSPNCTDLLQPWLFEIWSNMYLCLYLKYIYLITQEMHLGIFDKSLCCSWILFHSQSLMNEKSPNEILNKEFNPC